MFTVEFRWNSGVWEQAEQAHDADDLPMSDAVCLIYVSHSLLRRQGIPYTSCRTVAVICF